MNNRRRGVIGGAVALAAGLAVVARQRVVSQRREGLAEQPKLVAPKPDRHGYVTADDGVDLYYEEDGPTDAPVTVVFSHGFCLSRDDFLFQRRALREHYGDSIRLIAYDQRSHGKSDRCASEHASIDQLGADLYLIIEALAPGERLVLVGHSMGGMTIMALADRHPELFGPGGQVAGVALLSTSTGKLATVTLGLPAALAKLQTPLLPVLLSGARKRASLVERGRAHTSDFAWVYLKRFAFGHDVDPALVEFLSGLVAGTRIDVIADFYPTLMDHDKLAALGTLRDTPVAVVCGENDQLTPLDHTRTIAAELPHAELVIVPQAGHQALMERPDEVTAPIIRLIDDALAEAERRERKRAAQ